MSNTIGKYCTNKKINNLYCKFYYKNEKINK